MRHIQIAVFVEPSRSKAANAIDGSLQTFWHTEWSAGSPRHPHEIVIDMSESREIKGFFYLPRQDGPANGTTKDYEFYLGNDPKDFGAPVAKGAFKGNTDLKKVKFAAKKGRYLKLRALSEVNGQPCTSAAEIGILD